MLFRQLLDRDTCTFTYIIAEDYGKPAAIIDPVLEHIEQYNKLIKDFDLKLLYCIETHTHADHITASGHLAKQHDCKIVMGAESQAQHVDIKLHDGEKLKIGTLEFTAIATPGHTDESYSYYLDGMLFTGDCLLIRGSGRTDFQNGSAIKEYQSITQKLFSYPDETLVYPAHDYKVFTVSTIGEEKRFNPRLQVKSADEYAAIMNQLNLERPQKMDIAVPANLQCGLTEK